uniref:Uncharacterized protein n=1 Tax=Solanum tuberosum TaxID=4113 RepID=M1DKV2_SOLTU
MATDRVGKSPKKPAIKSIPPFDSRYLQNVDSVNLGKLRTISVNHLPDRRPQWLQPFEHPQLLRSSVKIGEVKICLAKRRITQKPKRCHRMGRNTNWISCRPTHKKVAD